MNLFSGSNRHPIISSFSDEELWKFVMASSAESLVKYYDDITESVLKQEFPFKKCPKKHIWYGEWENHRRPVIKLQQLHCYQVLFGYNYDFIPAFTLDDKISYFRTDKSVDVQIRDYYYYHILDECNNLAPKETYLFKKRYELTVYGCCEDMEKVFSYLKDVIQTNIPLIKDFFNIYRDDRDVLTFIDYAIENGTSFRIYPEIWAKAFLLAKLHEMDQAKKTLQSMYDRINSGVIPPKVMAHLEKVNSSNIG